MVQFLPSHRATESTLQTKPNHSALSRQLRLQPRCRLPLAPWSAASIIPSQPSQLPVTTANLGLAGPGLLASHLQPQMFFLRGHTESGAWHRGSVVFSLYQTSRAACRSAPHFRPAIAGPITFRWGIGYLSGGGPGLVPRKGPSSCSTSHEGDIIWLSTKWDVTVCTAL